MNNRFFPLDTPEHCYCDVLLYDINQFNLKLRAYREADPLNGVDYYRYYLIDFFFTLHFQGPFFWKGMNVRQGTDSEMSGIAPFALERRQEAINENRLQVPRLYCLETDLGPVRIIASMVRIYAHNSPTPFSLHGRTGEWFASWPIIFEDGFRPN